MKVGDLVKAPECTGYYCGCVFCAGGSTNRIGLVIDHEIVGTANDMFLVRFDFGEWSLRDNEVTVVNE